MMMMRLAPQLRRATDAVNDVTDNDVTDNDVTDNEVTDNDVTDNDVTDNDRLVGLVVKASASGAEDPGFESRLRRHFSGSSHTSDLKTGTPVATLPGALRYRVSAGNGRPGVSVL